MQLTGNNPLFQTPSQDIAQTYGDKLFNYSVAPELGSAAEQQWLGGNLGNQGSSSFGADYLSNLEASGRQQSFLGGQQYYDDLLNNTLNERNNFFGNDVQPAMQADEFNQGQNTARLGLLNNFNLDQAQGYNSLANTSVGNANSAIGAANSGFGQSNFLSNQALNANAASARNQAGLLTGGAGLLGGALNATGASKAIGSGIGNLAKRFYGGFGGGGSSGAGGAASSFLPQAGGSLLDLLSF